MAISQKVHDFMERASWIRKMFEEGIRLKQQFGAENVFDLSLGNPVAEPPRELVDAMISAAQEEMTGQHRYMPNAGYEATRRAVAESLSEECKVSLSSDDIVMVCGAAGGLNITLKTLLDPGDEVIVFAPYFVEYLFYADNHGGKAVAVNTRDDFSIDLESFRAAVTSKTKAVIINSPNNPTGVVYSRQALQELADALREKSQEIGHAIYLISDDPYKKIVFDGLETPNILDLYENSIYPTLGPPGWRKGNHPIFS